MCDNLTVIVSVPMSVFDFVVCLILHRSFCDYGNSEQFIAAKLSPVGLAM